jgi:HAD superfamily hydrolase (TIGR01484 family)
MQAYRTYKDYREKLKKELDIKVLYTDLDGTLLNDTGCLIKDVEGKFFYDALSLFKKIEDKGWDIVLVSGRSRVQLRYNAQLMGLKNFIPELGCEMVYDLGKEVHVTFDREKFNYKITKGGSDLVKIIDIFKKAFPGRIESYLEWSMGRSYNALFFGDIDIGRANRLLAENGYKGLELVDNGFSKLVSLDIDVEHLRIYNLIPKGVDKASAIKLDRKIRNLEKNNCIALGDSVEDIKMAKEVGAFFLMKNAIDRDGGVAELIKNYDNIYVTGKLMNHGWTEVMDYLLK